MCEFFSAIATRDGRLLFCESDSHEEIIARAKLRDTDAHVRHWVRIEVRPQGDGWGPVRVDEALTPEWWTEDRAVWEDKVLALARRVRPAWEAYGAVQRQAWETYQAAVRPAWEAYEAAERSARETYEAVERSAREAYQAVERPSWKAYNAAERPAWEAYQAVLRPAWEAYQAVEPSARKARLAHLTPITGYVSQRAFRSE